MRSWVVRFSSWTGENQRAQGFRELGRGAYPYFAMWRLLLRFSRRACRNALAPCGDEGFRREYIYAISWAIRTYVTRYLLIARTRHCSGVCLVLRTLGTHALNLTNTSSPMVCRIGVQSIDVQPYIDLAATGKRWMLHCPDSVLIRLDMKPSSITTTCSHSQTRLTMYGGGSSQL